MNQKGRILTLVVEFQEDEYPQWIMEAHMGKPQHGIRVKTIQEGDFTEETEELLAADDDFEY